MWSAYCVLAISRLGMHALVRFDRATEGRMYSTAKRKNINNIQLGKSQFGRELQRYVDEFTYLFNRILLVFKV